MATSEGLGSALAAELSSHELISIDVFDTMVLRAVSQPVDVFALVSLTIAGTSEGLLQATLLDEFPRLRIDAERLAREAARRSGENSEVTFDQIYHALASMAHVGPELLARLKQTELDVELRLAYPNPVAKSIWAAALAAGKKVVFCSDMYLPSAFIAKVLAKCGCDRYDALYVSCEHSRSKYEGTLLPYVAAKYGVAPEGVLHLGDNLHSDCVMARRSGCSAVHLPQTQQVGSAASPDPVGTISLGLTRKLAVSLNGDGLDAYRRIGYSVFGPLLTGFLLWLAGKAKQRRPERILLFARDTHLIRKYLPRFLCASGATCEIDYAYVSRGALLLPSFTDFPLTRLYHLFSGKAPKTVAYHLLKFGLTPALFGGVVRSCGYQSVEDPVSNGDPRMHALLTKLHRELLLESARRRPLVRRYLSRFLEGASRIMAVDVGWVGNMQASFLRILAPLPEQLDFRGYYVGLHGVARENDYPGHHMEGWLLHYGEPPGLEKRIWWSGGVELLEFALCAPHGTTLGYAVNETGGVEPVLECEDWDSEGRAKRARLQEGIGMFVEEFCATCSELPASLLASREWASEFYRLVTAPEPWETDALGDVMHSDEAGGTRSRLPLAPKLNASERKDVAEALKRCYWKAGLAVRNNLDGLLDNQA